MPNFAQNRFGHEATTQIMGAAYTRLQRLRDAGLKFVALRAVVLDAMRDAAQHIFEYKTERF